MKQARLFFSTILRVLQEEKRVDVIVNQLAGTAFQGRGIEFEFSKFRGKNLPKITIFLFHKNQVGKSFFL